MKLFRNFVVAGAMLAGTVAGAVELGDDGLHKTDWMRDSFFDLREDLELAKEEGKRFALIIEQRGCAYCRRMHNDIFPTPEIDAMLHDDYYIVQMNMFGDLEVTDFDGEVLTEKEIMFKWRVNFTPTIMFFPEEVPEGLDASRAAVAQLPGAFGKGTTLAILEWVVDKGYEKGISLQKVVAEKFD
jgi:thioredoxin-related protein